MGAIPPVTSSRTGTPGHRRSKGAADRNAPIVAIAVEAIDAYLADRERRFGTVDPADPLFVVRDGSPITSAMIEYRVDLWFRWGGLVPLAQGAAHQAFEERTTIGKTVLTPCPSGNPRSTPLG